MHAQPARTQHRGSERAYAAACEAVASRSVGVVVWCDSRPTHLRRPRCGTTGDAPVAAAPVDAADTDAAAPRPAERCSLRPRELEAGGTHTNVARVRAGRATCVSTPTRTRRTHLRRDRSPIRTGGAPTTRSLGFTADASAGGAAALLAAAVAVRVAGNCGRAGAAYLSTTVGTSSLSEPPSLSSE